MLLGQKTTTKTVKALSSAVKFGTAWMKIMMVSCVTEGRATTRTVQVSVKYSVPIMFKLIPISYVALTIFRHCRYPLRLVKIRRVKYDKKVFCRSVSFD